MPESAPPPAETPAALRGFLADGGEMGALTRDFDWSTTVLGPVADWPQSLRTTVSIILSSKSPMFLWWGPDLIQFYNDAYRPSLGNAGKHPAALGQRGAECWPEIWPTIHPLIQQVRAGGEATWSEDQLIPIFRNGRLEDVYWTFGYSPVTDESGHVGGVLVVCSETTNQVAHVNSLRLSDQRFQNLVREASVGIVVLHGEQMRVGVVNETYGRLIGFAPAQLRDRPLFDFIPEAEAEFRPLLENVRRTGEPLYLYGHPYQGQAAGATIERFLDVVYQPYKEADGTITGVMALCHDVTEQVRARRQTENLQALVLAAAQHQAREQEKYHQIFAHTPAAICIQRGPDHRYEYVNAAYQQFFPDRQLLGRPVAEALPETVDAGIVALLDAVYRTGETYFGHEQPLQVAQPNGLPPKLMYFTFTYQAYRENGEIVGISTFAYDVADQVLARQRQQEQLHELFEQAPVAVAVFRGPHYVIELANPALCALWGRTLARTLGTPLFELLPEISGQGFKELLDGVRATGIPHVAHEMPSTINRNGRRDTVYWNFVYQPLREANGPITAVTVVATDVTEQVLARERVQALNRELATTNAQLRRTNVDLDTFIYTASHDLNQPIANIDGLLAALREHLPTEAYQDPLVPRLLALMQQDVERFQRTIHQLTHLSRLQQVYDAPAEAVDVAAAVEGVRLDLAPLLAGAQLTVAIAPGLHVHFPPHNLRSVVYNLLSNALKYRHPGRPPVVHLRAYLAGPTAVLEVEDNGLGLDAAQQAQLFGLFKRLHTHVEGTGMGLYIVKRLVENAGGTITVRSQAGAGTTFTVTFPA